MVTLHYLDMMKNVARGHRLTIPEPENDDIGIHVESIRGLLNRKVYGSALEWMMPKWVIDIRKKKEIKKEQILLNTQHCNWALIGGVGGTFAGVTDEAGLVMANPECGALEFWIYDNKNYVFPALLSENRLKLTSEEDQLFTWSYHVGAVEFCRHVYYVKHGNHEAIYNEVEIRNKSLADTQITFFAAVRPMSVRGVEPIIDLVFDEGSKRVYANGLIALECDKRPSAIIMTTADNPNLLSDAKSMRTRWDTQFHTARGLATVILRFDISLRAARTTTMFFVQPLNPLKEGRLSFKKNIDVRYESVGKWFEYMNDTLTAMFPETRLDGAFKMAKATLAIRAHKVLSSDSDFTDGERARLILALCQIGGLDLARNVSLTLRDEALSAIEDGNWSKALILSLGVLRSGKYIKEEKYYSDLLPFSKKLHAVLVERLKTTYTGKALPPSVTNPATQSVASWTAPASESVSEPAIENSRVTDYEGGVFESMKPTEQNDMNRLIEMQWLLSVGWELVDILDHSGIRDKAEELYRLCERFSELAKDKWSQEFNFSKFSGGKKIITEMLGLFDLAVLGSKELCIPERYIDECALTVRTLLMRKGLLKVPGREESRANYLALRLAQIYALRHDSDSIESILTYVLKTTSMFNSIPDEIGEIASPQVRCGTGIRAAIDLVLLMRLMIVREQEENLELLGGISDDWFVSPKDLAVTGVFTSMGKMNITLGMSANQHQIDIQMEDLPRELQIYVTSYRNIMVYKAFGGSLIERVESPIAPFLRVIPLSDNVVITYHK